MIDVKTKAGGINTIIIQTLKEFNDEIPIDFLARRIGRERTEILKYLEALETEGIIKHKGNNVSISY